jgi:hypothetical protein
MDSHAESFEVTPDDQGVYLIPAQAVDSVDPDLLKVVPGSILEKLLPSRAFGHGDLPTDAVVDIAFDELHLGVKL